METHLPLTSPDGSRNRNTPERCPSPLYSWDFTRERHKVLRCYQYKKLKHNKTEMKEEAKETFLMGDGPCKEKEIPIKISTDPGGTRVTPRNIKTEEEEKGNVKIKKEKTPPEISTDPGDTQRVVKAEEEEGHVKIKKEEIPPEIGTDPGDTRVTSRNIKTEKEEEGNVRIKEEKIPPEISTDTRDTQRNIKEEGQRTMKEEKIVTKISTDTSDTRDTQRNLEPKEDREHLNIKKEQNTPEISTDSNGDRPLTSSFSDPRGSRAAETNIKAEDEERHVKAKRKILEIGMDGSRNRNSPERCPSPLYSWDSTRERHKVLRCYQYKKLKLNKTEMKEEAKETFLMGDGPCKEEIPIKISPDPADTRNTHRNIKPEEDRGNLNIKKEENTPEISTVDSNGVRPLTSSFSDPRGNRAAETNIKAEDEERRVKAKRKILEIGMDGRYRWYNTEKWPDSEIVDADIAAYVAKEKARTANLQPVRYKDEKPYSCPECGKRFTHEKYLIIHHRCHSGEKPFFCAECGKSFSYRSSLDKHKVTHTTVGAFPCPECGKRFRAGWILAAHGRVHSSENVHR